MYHVLFLRLAFVTYVQAASRQHSRVNQNCCCCLALYPLLLKARSVLLLTVWLTEKNNTSMQKVLISVLCDEVWTREKEIENSIFLLLPSPLSTPRRSTVHHRITSDKCNLIQMTVSEV